MAVTLLKKDLSLGQLKFIRICCTFFLDPISKENQTSRKYLENLRSDSTIPSIAIDFALKNFFGPLDPILIKYLSKKLYNNNKYNYGNKDIKPPIEMFISTEDTVSMPLMLGNLLTSKLHNLEKTFTERKFSFRGHLRDYQKEIMPQFEGHLNDFGTTIVGLYPGAGKTIIGAYLSSKKKLLTCVLIHLSIQINQWKNTFEQFTNAKIWIVGSDLGDLDVDVIICMEERLPKIPKNLRDKIGTVIIDEAHCFCTPSRVQCWFLEPKYLILETATLKRPEDAMERIAYASCGNWGVFIPSSKEFSVIPVKTGIKPPVIKNKQGSLDWDKRIKFLLSSDQRNQQIIELIKRKKKDGVKIRDSKNIKDKNIKCGDKNIKDKEVKIVKREEAKILILIPQTEFVYQLADKIRKLGYTVSTFCENDKGYTDAPILIGTVSKIGTAFDEATCCSTYNGKRLNVIFLCITIRKPTLLEQSIGRIMRSDSPETYVFLDDDSPSNEHWNLMKWWFANYTCAEIETPLVFK